MRVHKHVVNLTPPEEVQFDEYLEQKLGRIRTFVERHFPDQDTVVFHSNMERHEKHTAFEMRVKLTMPGFDPFVTDAVKHSVTEPMDIVFDRLDQMIHKEFDKRRTKK
jgi:ribosome-associated translation inhibitor RaiA